MTSTRRRCSDYESLGKEKRSGGEILGRETDSEVEESNVETEAMSKLIAFISILPRIQLCILHLIRHLNNTKKRNYK